MTPRPTDLEAISRRLGRAVAKLRFAAPVTHVYNPLEYAWELHAAYLRRFGAGPKETVFVGMNPGPWGMAQTGVPFGEVSAVGDWMGLSGQVGRPRREHPKRKVEGLGCARSEVSGRRLWGWVEDRFGEPERFFERFFIGNYCPLSFMEASGRNRTPDKLAAHERRKLFELCDRALADMVRALEVRRVVGVGRFAEDRARIALAGQDVEIGRILHPSPANPAANHGWVETIERQLDELGVVL